MCLWGAAAFEATIYRCLTFSRVGAVFFRLAFTPNKKFLVQMHFQRHIEAPAWFSLVATLQPPHY